MKKVFVMVFGLVFLFAGIASAQTWFTANQVTVAWDAVAKIAATDTIKYQVYTRVGTTGDGTAVGGEITANQLVITFPAEGRYFIGVKSIRYPAGETVGIPSVTTSWSNDASVCSSAGPFGIVFYAAPSGVQGLKPVQ